MPPVTITSGSGTTDDGCPSSGSVNPNGLVAVTLIGLIVLVPVAPGLLGDSGTSVDWLPLLTTTTGSARAGRPRASAATTTAIDFVCMTTPHPSPPGPRQREEGRAPFIAVTEQLCQLLF